MKKKVELTYSRGIEAVIDALEYIKSEVVGKRDFAEYADTLERLIAGYIRNLDDPREKEAMCDLLRRLSVYCGDEKTE